MDKLTSNMMRPVQDLLRNSKDVSVQTIHPFTSDKEFLRFLNDLKSTISKNKGKTLTIIVSLN